MVRKITKMLLAMLLVMSCLIDLNSVTLNAKSNDIIIDVTDFGADPSGKKDSTEAVRQALEKAKQYKEKVIINFPTGEYHFWKDYATKRNYHTSNTSSLSYPEKYIGILVEDNDNITLEGNNSSIIMHGDMMAIAAVNSKDVVFRNFVLDYEVPDTIDISVVANGESEEGKYTDFYIPDNYNYIIEDNKITWQSEISPVTNAPYWQKTNDDFLAYLVIYKGYDQTVARAGNKEASSPFTGVSSIKQIGENVVRFTYSGNRPQDQEPGNIFLLSDSATRKTTGAFFWESENLLVENIDVHYLSGFGWLVQMCKNIEFKGIDFLPRYGTGKYTTSNADQIHVAGCGGYFKVTDCNFSMAHDDPINVHGSYMRVEEVIDNKTLKLRYIHSQQGGFRQFHQNDEVLFYSRTYLEPPAGEDEEKPYIVESSVAPGEEYNGTTLDMRTEIVTFKEEFSEETLNDLKIKVTRNGQTEKEGLYVAENVTYTPEVRISGNHMKSIPTRGILCTTRKPVIIENNTFDNMAMANIYLSNDADYWYESGPIRNMIIRNNKFYIRPTGQAEWGNVSGIFVDPVVLSGLQDAPAPKGDTPVHRNITIESNEFHMANDNVVSATGVDGIKILNNKIIRDNANLNISLTTNENLGIGESQKIETNVDETVLTKDIFKFTNCKNVLISGNSYDDGLNLNVTTSGSKMTEKDVVIEDDLTLNKTGGNKITSASKIKYVTSNPEIAYVNEQGELVGVSQGTVTLAAYVTWNGTVVKSNEIKVNVGKEYTSTIELEADKTEVLEENGTVALNYTQGATIEVLDPITNLATNKAIVENNTYTALKEGLVLVKATKNGKSTSILIVNSFEKSYGSVDYLQNDVSIDLLQKENIFGSKGEVEIVAQPGSELFGGSKNVNNLVKIKIPEVLKNDLRIQVDVKGLPVTGDAWNNAGIILYKNGDNYLSVGKKGHISGIASVYEKDATANEVPGLSEDNNITSTTFEIEVKDNTATIRYKNSAGKWKVAYTQNNVSEIMDSDVYLALCAWQTGGSDFSTSFSNIKIARASNTSTEDMSNVKANDIFAPFDNERSTITNAELTVNGVNNKATVKAEVSKNTKSVVYQWILKDKEGQIKDVQFSTSNNYIPKYEGKLVVKVIALDYYGKPSFVMTSNEEKVILNLTYAEELNNLYINGNKVEDFDKENASFSLLADTTNKLRISYDLENTGVKTVIKDGKGNILATLSDKNEAIIDVPDKLVIERGSTKYSINIKPQKEVDLTIDELNVNDAEINLNVDEIKIGTNSYFKQVDGTTATIKLAVSGDVESINVTRSFFEKTVDNEANGTGVFEANVDLTAGINAFYIKILAADGVTEKIVRLYLFHDGFNDSTLNDLKVNGISVEDFSADISEYVVYADNADKTINIEAIKNDSQQIVSITKDGKRIDENTGEFDLKSGINQIIVASKAANMWRTSYYVINVILISDSNADLLTLKTDENMNPEFDVLNSKVTDYSITMYDNSLHLYAKTQMKDAKIKLSTDTQSFEEINEIDVDIDVYEGENTINLEVTAPDGKTTKMYKIKVNALGIVYASDVIDLAYKQEVGFGSLMLDKASSGNALALVNEQNERVEFEKGLGAHAYSEIAYNIEGQGYEKFEAYVGIDYYQVTNNADMASVIFKVLVDGVEKFNSEKMTINDAMKKVSVDIKNAKKIELIVDEIEYNYYDHADWADALFVKPLPDKPQTTIDKTTLKIAIDKANEITDDDLANVVPVVVNEFKAARDEANSVYNNETATQEEINNAFDRLASAMQKLEFFKGDKTALQAFVDKVSNLEQGKYTESSWSAFEAALNKADEVLVNENALETEVNEAYDALVRAFLDLRLVPNKDLLNDLINKAESLEATNYSADTFKAMQEALASAKVVAANKNATQAEVDNAKDVLAKAIDALKATSVVDNNLTTPATDNKVTSINNGDTTSVKTGDSANLLGAFGVVSSLSVIAYLKKKRRK